MRILRFGSSGPSVQFLQLALNRAGFGELATDGVFGPATQEALRRFQEAAGLEPDGIAGRRSHAALRPWYTGYLLHTLQPGDSFWSLGQRYGSGEAAVALAKDWRTDKILRRLEALLLVADKDKLLLLSGNGEVIEPDGDIAAMGSGGFYALAAGRALVAHTDMTAAEIAKESLSIAADICVFTNQNIVVEELG